MVQALVKRPLFVLGVVVVTFLVFGAAHLDGLRWDYDEGVHAMEALLALDGLPLYSVVFSSDMPLFIGSLASAFAVFGPSIQLARLVTLLYSALGLLAIGLLAHSLGHPLCVKLEGVAFWSTI